MSNNIYSDQGNNSNLYANKLFDGEESEQVENLGGQISGGENDKSKENLLKECRDENGRVGGELLECKKGALEAQLEIEKAKKEISGLKLQVQEEKGKVEQTKNEAEAAKDKLKLQVQEEREKVEEEFKNKLKEAESEAKKAKDELIQCKKDTEKMKENGGQAINQEKCDDTKAEAEQAKLEAKLAKEEVLRCKIEQEKEEVMRSKIEEVKEELLKCKIDIAKAETEWYKKAAEECKNEKRIGTDKPSIRGEDGIDTGKPVTNEGGNENGEITSREITPDRSLPEICGLHAPLYKVNNKIGSQGFNTSDLLKELYPEMYSNSKIVPYIEKGSEGVYGAVNFKFAFTDTISSAANFGNTKCLECIDSPLELACQEEKVKSFCQSGNDCANKEWLCCIASVG